MDSLKEKSVLFRKLSYRTLLERSFNERHEQMAAKEPSITHKMVLGVLNKINPQVS